MVQKLPAGHKPFGSSFDATCGFREVAVNVNADGSYDVPEMALEIDNSPGQKPQLEISAHLSVKDTAPNYPYGFGKLDLIGLFDFKVPSTSKVPEEIRNFTLFQSEPQDISIELASGTNVQDWLSNKGRDLNVSFEIDFSNGKVPNRLFQSNPYMTSFERGPRDTGLWWKLPKKIFIVAGKLQKDTRVRISHSNFEDVQGRFHSFPFSSQFPKEALTVRIDDSKYDDPQALRSIERVWKNGYFNLGFNYENEVAHLSGDRYFTADLKCTDSRVSGELIFRDGQLTTLSKEIWRAPVTGICHGETAEIAFGLELKSGETLPLTFKVTKISASINQAYVSAAMISSDKSPYDISSDLSYQIEVRNTQGESVGNLNIFLNE